MRALRIIAVLLPAIYALGQFVPFNPHPYFGGCDDSWQVVYQVAWLKHWQWGRDLVWTIGPYGFIWGGYNPETHALACVLWSALALIWVVAGMFTALLYVKNWFVACAGVWLFTVLATVHSFLGTDAIGVGFVLMLVMGTKAESGNLKAEIIPFMIVVALALLSLVHVSALVLAGVVLAIISVRDWLQHRRWPVLLLIWVGATGSFWCLAHQDPFNFLPWLRQSMQIVGAYGDAMSQTSAAESSDLIMWFCACALLAVVLWKYSSSRFQLSAFGFVIFTAFKHGFIRHDNHEVWCWSELSMVALCSLALAFKAEIRNHEIRN